MSAVLPCVLAFLSGAVPTWLCFKLKADNLEYKNRTLTRNEFSEKSQALCNRIDELEARVLNFEQIRDEHEEWISEAESINLNHRGQVLRLHRRGESVPGIASALRMGQGEVKLIIKVFELGNTDLPSEES